MMLYLNNILSIYKLQSCFPVFKKIETVNKCNPYLTQAFFVRDPGTLCVPRLCISKSIDLLVNKLTWYVKHPMLFGNNPMSIKCPYQVRMLSRFKRSAILELQSWIRSCSELIKKHSGKTS